MTHSNLPAGPEPRDITPFTDVPRVYPPYTVQFTDGQQLFDIRSLYGMIRRNWWLVIALMGLGAGAGYWLFRHTTPVYFAYAMIQVDEEDQATETGIIPIYTSSFGSITTEMQIIGSRSIAEQVVDALDLQLQLVRPTRVPRDVLLEDLSVAENAPNGRLRLVRGGDPQTFRLEDISQRKIADVRIGEPVESRGLRFTLTPAAQRHQEIVLGVIPRRAAAQRIQSALRIRRPNEEDLYNNIVMVALQHPDRLMASAVPNMVTAKFIDWRREKHRKEANSTVQFLVGQLDTLNTQLREAEERLRVYREENNVVDLTTEGATKISQVSSYEVERAAIEVRRNALARVLEEVRPTSTTDPMAPSPYRRLGSHPVLLENSNVQSLLTIVNDLEGERAELLERRTVTDPDVVALTERIQDIERQLEENIQTYYRGLDNQVGHYTSIAGRSAGTLSAIPAKEQQFLRLLGEVELLRETYSLLQTRLRESEISQAVEDAGVEVIDPAIVPNRPVKPRLLTNLLMGVLLGLVLGVGGAFARESLDNTIHTRDDLKELTGVPVLGLIPSIRPAAGAVANASGRLLRRRGSGNGKALAPPAKGSESLVTEYHRTHAASEAFRSLRTNITFSSAEKVPKVFVVTSALPQDGKTTTAANLAIIFAQQGLRVLLVDGDMRRGTLHDLFKLERTPGLSNLLVEHGEMERAIHWVSLEEGTELEILPGGTVPPNPAELLSSSRAAWLIEQFRERYDAIVLDTPPLTLVTDAAVLATRADTVLFVARANQTEEGAIRFAVEQLRNVRAPVHGAVLNDVDYKRDARYGGYDYAGYSYDYSSDS